MAKENQITCPKCEKDIQKDKIENGRCPECEFNIQMYLDRRAIRDLEEKERKIEETKNPKTPEKKKGLFGTGFNV